MNVPSMTAWLRRYMRDTVATDAISTQVVSLCEGELDLWPSRYIIGSVADFKGEVPHHSSISLLAFVCVLAHSTFVSRMHLPVLAADNIEL